MIKEPTMDITIINEYKNRIDSMQPGKPQKFISAIWRLFDHYAILSYDGSYANEIVFSSAKEAYRELCGRPTDDCDTFDEFFNSNLMSALSDYFGDAEAGRIKDECILASEGPCPQYDLRPFCRSTLIGDYAKVFFKTMASAVLFACYGLRLERLLTAYSQFPTGIDNHIALELRRGNNDVFIRIKEGITGEGSHAKLRQRFLPIISKSGSPQALELIRELASGQEHLEDFLYAISSTCNDGAISSHIYFIKLILENGLCRFPSVATAFDSWTGLVYEDRDLSAVEKRMSLALKFLTDKSAAMDSLFTGDITEVSIALWALCRLDTHKAAASAGFLLDSPEKFRRLAGWYYITLAGSDSYRHSVAVKHLHLRDPEELAWVTANLHINVELLNSDNYWNEDDEKTGLTKTYYDKEYPDDPTERAALFCQLADIAAFMSQKGINGANSRNAGTKNMVRNRSIRDIKVIRSIYSNKNAAMFTEYTGSAFPWLVYSHVNSYSPLRLMLALAAYDRSIDLTMRLKDYIPIMNETHRKLYYCTLLNPKIPEQREIILAGLSDRVSYVRIGVANRLKHYPFDSAEMGRLLKTLTMGNTALRKAIVEIIGNRDEPLVRMAVNSLLDSRNRNQIIAGKELIDLYSKNNSDFRTEYKDTITEYTDENGFGLFNPRDKVFDIASRAAKRPDIKLLDDSQLKTLIVPDEKEVISLYERIADTFIRYCDYQYKTEDRYGTYKNVALGDDPYRIRILAGKGDNFIEHYLPSWARQNISYPISHYPLSEKWLAAAGDFAENSAAMAALESLWAVKSRSIQYAEWFYRLFSGYPIEPWQLVDKIQETVESKGVGFDKVREILSAIKHSQKTSQFNFALTAYINLINKIPAPRLGSECDVQEKGMEARILYIPSEPRKVLTNDYLAYWRQLVYNQIKTDAEFTDYFNEMWYEYLAAGRQEFYGLEPEDVFRAHHLSLISDDAIYMYFTTGPGAGKRMDSMTSSYGHERAVMEEYPAIKDLLATTIDRLVSIEENRGEIPASLTELASNIRSFNGGRRHFVKLLTALGNAGFHTIDKHSYIRADASKNERLSKLLRICMPAKDDTPENLQTELNKVETPVKLAVQAAVYAPAWAELLEKALAIDGLKHGVWFLHAQLCSWFSDELETQASVLSYVPHQQREYSAFDTRWFFEAYNVLGPKRFDELYINAEPIADSSGRYSQLRLFMDAALGRLAKNDAVAEIAKSRDRGMLCAYALIPLDSKNPGDAFERYEFILRFRFESRKSNSARQKKERDACRTAFENLAMTAGYDGAERMIWAFEGQNPGFLRPLTEPRRISGTEVWLNITKYGTPEMIVSKNGESPVALTKEQSHNEFVTEIRSAMIRLREQRKRAPGHFEAAMASRSEFTAEEVAGLLRHPILHDMVSALVFIAGDIVGFPVLGECESGGYELEYGNSGVDKAEGYGKLGRFLELEDANGKHRKVMGNLIIAHPIDFINRQCREAYQRRVYHKKIEQPFNQVFREHYPIQGDEPETVNVSHRFKGRLVGQNRMEYKLVDRGWRTDCNTWMQKVWHKENLISRVSGADGRNLQAPGAGLSDGAGSWTLETVQFVSRDKYELVPFVAVPPIVFSETMRDIDIAAYESRWVKTAFQASHPILEMRIAVAREMLNMRSIKNVTFQAEYAQISGSMNVYLVHMGTGAVYKPGFMKLNTSPAATAAIRRVFIPFEDCDAETIEILSNILLFANDKKIKDIGLLEQLEADWLLPPREFV